MDNQEKTIEELERENQRLKKKLKETVDIVKPNKELQITKTHQPDLLKNQIEEDTLNK